MFSGWRYDDGKPIWSDTISDFVGEPRRPAWCVSWWGKPPTGDSEIERWLADNAPGAHDTAWRFNGGDPVLSIEIHDEDAALAFRMRWL